MRETLICRDQGCSDSTQPRRVLFWEPSIEVPRDTMNEPARYRTVLGVSASWIESRPSRKIESFFRTRRYQRGCIPLRPGESDGDKFILPLACEEIGGVSVSWRPWRSTLSDSGTGMACSMLVRGPEVTSKASHNQTLKRKDPIYLGGSTSLHCFWLTGAA